MNQDKVQENLKLVKEYTQGLGGESLKASLIGLDSALADGSPGAIAQNWADVKRDCAGIIHAEGFLNGSAGATAEDLGRALEKIEEGLNAEEKAPVKEKAEV